MRIKYIEIENYLKEIIKNGKDKELLPSEKDLVKKFNVSRMTVKKVYDHFEKEGLIYRKKGKGTFIRKINFKNKEFHFYYLIPHFLTYQHDPFYEEIFKGLIKKSIIYDIKSHFSNFNENYYSILNEIEKNECDAVISFLPEKIHYKFLEELTDRGYAVFAINRIIKNYNINYISTDHIGDSYRLTKEFLKRGKRNIGFIGVWEGHEFTEYRFEGYKKALEEGKIKIDEKLISYLPPSFPPDIMLPEKTINLIKKGRPEVIISTGGAFLPYILKGIKEIGLKIPEDIELATFDKIPDDIKEKNFIHEVIQPLEKMGELLIENVISVLKGEKGKVEILLPSKIIFKENKGGDVI